jgi:hypothetical protein
MNRRGLLTAIASSAAGISFFGQSALADEPTPTLPDIYKIAPNSETNLAAQSTAVVDGDSNFNLISLGLAACNLTIKAI